MHLSSKRKSAVVTSLLLSTVFVAYAIAQSLYNQWDSVMNGVGIALIFGMYARYPKTLFEPPTKQSFWRAPDMPVSAHILCCLGAMFITLSWALVWLNNAAC